MKRMFPALIILFVTVITYIIFYAAFAEPIEYIVNTLLSIDDTTADTMNMIPFLFSATVLFGILCTFGWFALVGHKKEYEQ